MQVALIEYSESHTNTQRWESRRDTCWEEGSWGDIHHTVNPKFEFALIK